MTSNLKPAFDPSKSRANESSRVEFALLALLFGSVGAISWAIRGTSGWNGVDGTIVPGMAWAVLWYWAARRWGIDVRGVTLWLGLGIAIGGELGYGQYVSWIRGEFHAGDRVFPIPPATGFLWFCLVGIAWGAPGGIALGWVLNNERPMRQWLVRLLVPMGVVMLGRMVIQAKPDWFFPLFNTGLYAPEPGSHVVSVSFLQRSAFMWGLWFVGVVFTWAVWGLLDKTIRNERLSNGLRHFSAIYVAISVMWIGSWLFFPQGNLGLIDGDLGDHLSRTVYTNSQNALVVAWWLGALAVAAWQQDWTTLIMGLIIGGGFGIGMPLSSIWCLGYSFAPSYIDWWKIWEMNAGFNLGALYLIALYVVAMKPDQFTDSKADAGEVPIAACSRMLVSAVGVLFVWMYLYIEDGTYAGLLLGPGYVLIVCWFCWRGRYQQNESAFRSQRQWLTLAASEYFLLFILLYGATSRLGVFLGFYEEAAAEQSAWPVARVWLFALLATPLLIATIHAVWHVARHDLVPEIPLEQLNRRIFGLVMLIGLVGVITIWPSKISAIYTALLLVALITLAQLNYRTTRDSME